MTFKWTTKHEINLTKYDFDEIVNVYIPANATMEFDDPYGEDFEELVKTAVIDWSATLDDEDYYVFNEDIVNQIALVVKNNYKVLKED